MTGKYLREYILFPDILVMSVLLIASVLFIVPHLSQLETWMAIAAGMLSYTLSEYTTHRFLFHMKPPENPFMLKLIKRLHYDHHVYPNNLHLLFLPLWYSLPNLAISMVLVFWITSSTLLTVAFAAGVIGYLLYYEWVHYVAHRPLKPFTPWGKWLKKYHLWHHYKNENYWYGVTNPAFDLVFGTKKDEKNVEKSETARNLENRYKLDV